MIPKHYVYYSLLELRQFKFVWYISDGPHAVVPISYASSQIVAQYG